MRLSLAATLGRRSDSELLALHDTWVGGAPAADRATRLRTLRQRMADPASASGMRAQLPDNAATVLDALLAGPKVGMGLESLLDALHGSGIKAGGLRGALAELVGVGLACSGRVHGKTPEVRWAVPLELREALQGAQRDDRELPELLTLHGHLERWFRKSGKPAAEAEEKARRMYRFLAAEASLTGRLEDLDSDLSELLRFAVSEWGGVVPVSALQSRGIGPRDLPGLRKALEEASLGTVGDLDLERFGIRQRGPVLAVFNEAVLAWLRRDAVQNPVSPAESASVGVDFVSNFARFASFVGDETVRFTVRGAIFKSTGRRIAESLIPNPGREFRRREVLELEYRFALAYRLIDRTGERSFLLTEAGRTFLRQPLAVQQKQMLDWLIEDLDLPGDMAHQLRLRRIALRFLKRLEPGLWYDAMFLPFVARNHYLATLSREQPPGADPASFPVRSSADLRSLAWNLFTWIRKHLYLLGVVEMGYDAAGHACALRLTPLGAELLGMIPSRELEGAGHLVVNPDFEVVLFPEERSHELIFQLDRFCDREFSDSLIHYRITPGSLHRALQQGFDLDEILELLRSRSRTPLPQNVLYSLESWARRDGMVTLHEDGRLVCDSPEILDRLELHPELHRLGVERVDRATLRLRGRIDQERLSGWVRDFGVSLRIAS